MSGSRTRNALTHGQGLGSGLAIGVLAGMFGDVTLIAITTLAALSLIIIPSLVKRRVLSDASDAEPDVNPNDTRGRETLEIDK